MWSQIRPYNADQLNLLNGDDYEDEDGCIYTYKEGTGFEDNLLDHLLTTCVSCGLPNFDLPKAALTNPDGNDDIMPNNLILPPPLELNGEQNEQENNLFSPEMDFLEMDFDPGSNADDLESDCDDNCFPSVKMLSRTGPILNGGQALHTEHSNNLSPERRTLMLCRRCENDSSIVGKVGNLFIGESESNNVLSPFGDESSSKSVLSLSRNPSHLALDDRPYTVISPKSGAITKHSDSYKHSIKKDTVVRPNDSTVRNSSVISHLDLKAKEALPSNIIDEPDAEGNCLIATRGADGGENDLERADDADDEGEDNSPTTAAPTPHLACPTNPSSRLNIQASSNPTVTPSQSPARSSIQKSSDITIKAGPNSILICSTGRVRDCVPSAFNTSLPASNNMNKDTASTNINSNDNGQQEQEANNNSNNNLGSLSAPQVSPAHEHPRHDSFKRSVSFHNQLSSPKYDNVCFVPHKNLVSYNETANDMAAMREYLDVDRRPAANGNHVFIDNISTINGSYNKANHRHSHPCNEHDRRWNGEQSLRREDNADSSTASRDRIVSNLPLQHRNVSSSNSSEKNNNINTISDNNNECRNRLGYVPPPGSGPPNGSQYNRSSNDANISACSSRLHSRETALFNIFPNSQPPTQVRIVNK